MVNSKFMKKKSYVFCYYVINSIAVVSPYVCYDFSRVFLTWSEKTFLFLPPSSSGYVSILTTFWFCPDPFVAVPPPPSNFFLYDYT